MKITDKFTDKADLVLFAGDCLEFLPTIPNESVDLVVTSPPYNLGKDYERSLDLDTYVCQQAAVIAQCARVLSPKGSLCWQVGNYVDNGRIEPLDILLYPKFRECHLALRNRIIWHFGHGLHASRRFSGRYEVILWFTKSDRYIFNLDAVRTPQKYPRKKHFKGPRKGQFSGHPLGKNPSDLWEIPNVKANHIEKTDHPCQFPVELVERLVLALTHQGSLVLDPFCGVGSTAIAALMHGRKALCAEIMPQYLKIARRRIEQAQQGELKIRPMKRAIHDPDAPGVQIPPQIVQFPKSPESGSPMEPMPRKEEK